MPLKNLRKRRAFNKAYYERNKLKFTEEARRRYRKWKNSLTPKQFHALNRRYRLQYRFKLTPESFRKILLAQGMRCKLCRELKKNFVVDHDHRCCKGRQSCGKCIRGLLCIRCNAMLGPVETVGIKKIIKYLGLRNVECVI
jgi:hypothetical protein